MTLKLGSLESARYLDGHNIKTKKIGLLLSENLRVTNGNILGIFWEYLENTSK